MRQDHHAAVRGRPRASRRRRDPHRRPDGVLGVSEDPHATRAAQSRDGVSELRDLAAHDVRAECGLPARVASAEPSRGEPRSSSASRTPWRRSSCTNTSTGRRTSCRVARSSGSRSPAPSSPIRRCCSWTSRCRTSTPACARRCAWRSGRCSAGSSSRVLYVTHDQAEALSMSNLVAVMRNGEVIQVGTPRQIYNEPATTFVAEFVGNINRFTGTFVESRNDGVEIDTPIGRLTSTRPTTERLRPGDPCEVIFRPNRSTCFRRRRASVAPQNPTVIPGTIARSVFYGQYVYTEVDVDGVLVRGHVHPSAEFRRGETSSCGSRTSRSGSSTPRRRPCRPGWKRPSETGSAEIDDDEDELRTVPTPRSHGHPSTVPDERHPKWRTPRALIGVAMTSALAVGLAAAAAAARPARAESGSAAGGEDHRLLHDAARGRPAAAEGGLRGRQSRLHAGDHPRLVERHGRPAAHRGAGPPAEGRRRRDQLAADGRPGGGGHPRHAAGGDHRQPAGPGQGG